MYAFYLTHLNGVSYLFRDYNHVIRQPHISYHSLHGLQSHTMHRCVNKFESLLVTFSDGRYAFQRFEIGILGLI